MANNRLYIKDHRSGCVFMLAKGDGVEWYPYGEEDYVARLAEFFHSSIEVRELPVLPSAERCPRCGSHEFVKEDRPTRTGGFCGLEHDDNVRSCCCGVRWKRPCPICAAGTEHDGMLREGIKPIERLLPGRVP